MDKRDYSNEHAMLNAVREAVSKALEDITSNSGVPGVKVMKLGNATFTSDGFTFKLEGVFEGGLNKQEKAYKDYGMYKTVKALGAVITYGAKCGKIVGANSTCTKVIIERGGKQYTLPIKYAHA